MSFDALFKSISSYRQKTTQTALANGSRHISFPKDWHTHNGRGQDGRSAPPKFRLLGMNTQEVLISEADPSSVHIHKKLDGDDKKKP